MDRRKDKVVAAFAARIRKDLPDAKVLLFGSRARGENLESSDYDIVVLSDSFKDTKMPNRFERVYRHWDHAYEADIIPYTHDEFEEFSRRLSIAGKAKQEGVFV